MGTKGDTGPVGPRGYPGPRGLPQVGSKGDTGNSGIVLTDNLDGTFTISTTNPPQSITFSNGAAGNTPILGVDYFDANSGSFVSYVYCQVLKGATAPTITNDTGSFDGTTEVMPTGPGVTWTDNPVFTEGYTTYVSKNRYIHDATTGGDGSWALKNSAWSTPVIYINPLTDPQVKFTSYAFIRATTVPTTPEGGDYISPTPTTPGWSDGVPVGIEPLYMSKRLFTSDGLTPQETGWHPPELVGQSGSGTKHQFGPSNTGPWDDIPESTDSWMIVCTQQVDGTWVCDTGNPIQIKGETGSQLQGMFKAYAFKRSETVLNERPEGGSFLAPAPVDNIVVGWTENIPIGTADLYVSTRLFTSDGAAPQDSQWSISQLFSGEGGVTYRIDVDSHVFSFDENDANPFPTEINLSVFRQNVAGTVVWTTVPAGVAATLTLSGTDDENAVLDATAFGVNQTVKLTATTGVYSDSVTIVRVKDGLQGPAGAATEIREVRFEYAPDVAGSPGTWHAKPLLGTDVWMREGTFYDGVLQGSWSAGTQIVGDDGTDVWTEFQFSDNDSDWHSTQLADDVYLQSRTVTDGTPGSWSATVHIRGDDGVDGKYFETLFAKSPVGTAPVHDATSPVFPDYDRTVEDPVGWSTDPNITLTGDEVVWAISTTKNHDGTLDVNWPAVAVQWGALTPQKGTDYTDGLAGVHVSKMYKSGATAGTLPAGGSYTAAGGETGVTANGWSDDPMSPQAAGDYIWETLQIYTASLDGNGENVYAVTTAWTTAIKYAYIPSLGTDYFNGDTGNEGDGQFTSFVFRNRPRGIVPSAPTGGSYNGVTETLPTNWTDDPQTPAGDEVTWVSKRLYTSIDGVWQTPPAWGTPSMFSAMTTFTGYLTNEAFLAPAEWDGSAPVLTGSGGGFETWYGDEEATTNTTFTVSGGSVNGSYHDLTTNGLTMRINQTTGIYQLIDNGWTDARDSEVFVLMATHNDTGDIVTLKYVIAKAKQGFQGNPGADGTDGADATTYYTWIKYADDAAGAGITDSPTGKAYLGIATNKTSPTESNNPADYTWQKSLGDDGGQGIPGDDGADGTTTYTWVKYATNATGTAGFSDNPTGRDYIGLAFNKTTPTESNTPGDYTWSLYVGADGVPGADGSDGNDGNTVAQLTIYRRATSTPSTPSGGSYNFDTNVCTAPTNWSSTIPGGTNPIYACIGLASIVGTSGTDSSIPWGSPEVIVQNGVDGDTGAAGKSVFQATVFKRAASAPGTPTGGSYNFTANTLTPPSTWFIAPPAGTDPLYQAQGTFEIIGTTGTDSTTTWSTPVLFVQDGTDGDDGDDGTNGSDGLDGSDGLSTYMPIIFRRSVSQPATPTGGSFNFGTNVLSVPTNWYEEPPAGTDPMYASSALASIVGDTGIDSSLTWSTPKIFTEHGDDGIDGEPGADALTILNYHQSHNFPADSNENVTDYSNSGTTIEVWEGETQLLYDGSGSSASRWDVGVISDVNITVGSVTDGGAVANVGNHSNITALTAFITYPIYGKRGDGTDFSATVTQVFSKAIQGPAGTSPINVTLAVDNSNISTDSDGNNGDYTQANNLILVYVGAAQIGYDGVGTADGSFKVTPTGTSITSGAVSDGGLSAIVADPSNMTADTANISFLIEGTDPDGNTFSLTKVQQFVKVKAPPGPLTFAHTANIGVDLVVTSEGGSITIRWYAARAASGWSGSPDLPGTSCEANLRRNGTIIETMPLTLFTESEPGFWTWSLSMATDTYVDTPGSGTWNYDITITNYSSGDSLHTNKSYISTSEPR